VVNCRRFAGEATAVACCRLWLSCAQLGEPAAFQSMAKIDSISRCNAMKKSMIKINSIPSFLCLMGRWNSHLYIKNSHQPVSETSHTYLVMFEACDK